MFSVKCCKQPLTECFMNHARSKMLQFRFSFFRVTMRIVISRNTALVFVVILLFCMIRFFGLSRNQSVHDTEVKYRDWMDYKLFVEESAREGLGEGGAHVNRFASVEEMDRNDEFIKTTGYSVIISDKISVNRSLPFAVHADCMKLKYLATLPSTSVIIIFHNEVKSVLLRTVHSIFNRTPPELLHEIILVNDHSSDAELYDPLRDYIAKHFPPKVKIKNLKKRSGLIVTRMEGARLATGKVLVFFDSHIEVNHNWLPPLLQPITENRRIATLPIVDYLNPITFGYIDNGGLQGTRGIIDWYLDFHEVEKLPENTADDLRMFQNPIMLGCAFAIDREFFLDELGGYDEGMQIWNGENYELSFKLWMCADGLFTVPCSRIGHAFRSVNPSRDSTEDFVARNFMRLAEVWLDEFKDHPRQLEPERYANVNAGDVTKQKAIRARLKCKSFRWFLENVAPEIVRIFSDSAFPPKFASGAIQSVANPQLCLDNFGIEMGGTLKLNKCSSNLKNPGSNQTFVYSFFKDIRQDHGRHEFCLDTSPLGMTKCNNLPYGNQFWTYDQTSKLISIENGETCLTYQPNAKKLMLRDCSDNITQQWNFGFVNHTAFEFFDDIFGY